MKKRRTLAFLGLATLGLFLSCPNSNQGADGPGASLSLSFSAGAKTILPDFSKAVDKIALRMSSAGQDPIERELGGFSESLLLSGLTEGQWSLTATAYANDLVVASGGASITLKPGSSQKLSVRLSFDYGKGKGDLSILARWPDSTLVDGLQWSIDDGTAQAAMIQSVSGYYTARLEASGLDAGAHLLWLGFKKGAISAGNFVEIVNVFAGQLSSSWVDAEGELLSQMDYPADGFLSSDTSLRGISLYDSGTSGPSLISFSSGNHEYYASAWPDSGRVTLSPTESLAGQYISYVWNDAASKPLASGDAATLKLKPSSANTLVLHVLAPNGVTGQDYTVHLDSGAVSVGISFVDEYSGFVLPKSVSIVQGQAFGLNSEDPDLAGLGQGWSWYLDGVKTEQAGGRFVREPSATSGMLGDYQVAATLDYGGVLYSQRLSLKVLRRASFVYYWDSTITNVATTGISDCSSLTYADGNFYAAHGTFVQKLNPQAMLFEAFAGNASPGGNDGLGTAASFTDLQDACTDGSYLYAVDGELHNIRRISLKTAAVTTLAGSATGEAGYLDGLGTAARFNKPTGVCTDGNSLYVADQGNRRIRKVDLSTGRVSTLAGSGDSGNANGLGTAASFKLPQGVTTDGTNVYVSDIGNANIRKIGPSGLVSVFCPAGVLTAPYRMYWDGSSLFVSDWVVMQVRQISGDGSTTIRVGPLYSQSVGGLCSDGNRLYVMSDAGGIYAFD